MNPSLEASWRHPWRQDLHTGVIEWLQGGVLEVHYSPQISLRHIPSALHIA
ncbi:hypothetical protein [Halorhodospira halochloris]|uniref:hypothetical protein n=1 Tax=Halorhodospira halochloris TaxID=1052 RepID=UPI00076F80A1|nr:hypothetical protein [Halorhodospira halochloris]